MGLLRPALIACSIATFSLAHAAHPLVTDDTGTQGSGRSQIELNADQFRQNGASGRSASFTYSYGMAENLDLMVGQPWTFSASTGPNDTALGMKWRLFERARVNLAFRPELLLPLGRPERGLGNGKPSLSLILIATHANAPWSWHGNLGVSFNRYSLQADQDANRASVLRASAAVWYALNERWKLVADTGISQSTVKAESRLPAFLLGGIIFSATKNLDLDAGIKFGLDCNQCRAAGLDRQVGVGLTSRF